MIKVNDLQFQYPGKGTVFALRGVSFSLEPGQRVALMGANGSGKTTFVLCLNGLLQPQSGEVIVDGFSTKDEGSLYEIRKRVGMVFQNPDNQIVTTAVVREIAFGLENIGISNKDMVNRVEEAMELFHLTRYRDHPPHLLSGGERQRLALAAVWAMQPNYLVLDEPTSLLDPRGRTEFRSFIERAQMEKKKGILLVTQFPYETLDFDRLIIMDRGKIVMDGSPDEVFQNIHELRRLGLGIPVETELRSFIEELEHGNQN